MTSPSSPPEQKTVPGPHKGAFCITPLRPIERGGLKGFGFSVHFGSHSSEPTSSPALTKPDAVPPPASGTISTGDA